MPRGANLYGTDFFAWTEQQATALHRLAERRINLDEDLDLTNLIDEVESMGLSQWKAVQTALARIIEHLLKLEFSEVPEPRRGWRESIGNQRLTISSDYEDSPSLRGRADLTRAWRLGRGFAVHSFQTHEPDLACTLPADCPYTLEQLLDDDWYPVNRHGLT